MTTRLSSIGGWKVVNRSLTLSSPSPSRAFFPSISPTNMIRMKLNRRLIIREFGSKTMEMSTLKVKDADKPWLSGAVPKYFWDSIVNRRSYLDWLGTKLGYLNRSDWYTVASKDFHSNLGKGLIHKYSNSPFALLSATYADYHYLPWLFAMTPKGFFDDVDNRRRFIDWLVEKVGVKSASELNSMHFQSSYGKGLFEKYGSSPQRLLDSLADSPLSNLSSEANMIGTEVVPRTLHQGKRQQSYWEASGNQREFLDTFGKEIGVTSNDLSPWYNVTTANFLKSGGGRLLSLYRGSLYAMLKAVYPDYPWLPWEFKYLSRVASEDPSLLGQAVDYVAQKFNLVTEGDWYRLSESDLKSIGVSYFFSKHGGLYTVLVKVKPDILWKEANFHSTKARPKVTHEQLINERTAVHL